MFLQGLGMFTGAIIMLFIAIYEHDIEDLINGSLWVTSMEEEHPRCHARKVIGASKISEWMLLVWDHDYCVLFVPLLWCVSGVRSCCGFVGSSSGGRVGRGSLQGVVSGFGVCLWGVGMIKMVFWRCLCVSLCYWGEGVEDKVSLHHTERGKTVGNVRELSMFLCVIEEERRREKPEEATERRREMTN